MKEGGGGDHLSVAWSQGEGEPVPIPPEFLFTQAPEAPPEDAGMPEPDAGPDLDAGVEPDADIEPDTSTKKTRLAGARSSFGSSSP